jgi:hypothetical protein
MFYSPGMTQSESALKKRFVTVRMTEAMYANLQRLAGAERGAVAEEIRRAIRLYLDTRGEIAGSRRYFTGRFRDEVRALRRELGWHLTLITILLAEVASILILNLVEMDEETAQAFSPGGLLKIAEERLVESGWRVQMRVSAAIDDAELEEQHQRDLAG